MLLPDLVFPDMKSECSISNVSLRVRFDTVHLCQCTHLLKAVCSFESDLSHSFAQFRGVPDVSGGKFITVASIRKCVYVLLFRLIL